MNRYEMIRPYIYKLLVVYVVFLQTCFNLEPSQQRYLFLKKKIFGSLLGSSLAEDRPLLLFSPCRK